MVVGCRLSAFSKSGYQHSAFGCQQEWLSGTIGNRQQENLFADG